jgi:type III restriction enzyme
MKFFQHTDFGFRQVVNVTGTAYMDDEYFPDVLFRYGLKQAIADKVVKKPNYKLEDTDSARDWRKTYAIHQQNWKDYGTEVKPITIVVTQEIARCVEVWRELVDFLVVQEKITRAEAEQKTIWVTSGVPSSGHPKARVAAAYAPRDDRDSPEKRRKENLAAHRTGAGARLAGASGFIQRAAGVDQQPRGMVGGHWQSAQISAGSGEHPVVGL